MGIYSKYTIFDRVWTYSRNYSQQLYECEKLYELNHGFAALTLLFNVFESISRSVLNDFASTSYDIFMNLYHNELLSEREYNFINIDEFCIRKIRNLYTHKNLSAFSLIVNEEGKEVLWPLTEPETSLLLYESISDILFNIIYKLIGMPYAVVESETDDKIITDRLIDKCDLRIQELSIIEMLKMKGFPENYLDDLTIPENDKIRLIENAPDQNVLHEIFQKIVGISTEQDTENVFSNESNS